MTLVERAAALLAGGPASTRRIARDVLGLTGNPEAAAAAVRALLGPDDRFALDGAGRWRLRDPVFDAGSGLGALRYAVVDVETTGGTPRRGHRITEIAVVEVVGGKVADTFRTLVDPGRPIPRRIVELTGITGEMVAPAPSFREVAEEVRRRLRGRVFVAHNVSFDWRFVGAELAEALGAVEEPPRLCTVRLSRRLVPELRRRNLDAVADYFDVDVRHRHRAYGDALATARILGRLLERARGRGVRTWPELEALLSGGGRRKGATGGRGREPRAAPGDDGTTTRHGGNR